MRRRSRLNSDPSEVDLTSMIDVVFLMIVFFVVTMKMDQSNRREDIRLEDSPNSIAADNQPHLTIQVMDSGAYYVGPARYSSRRLRQMLKSAGRETGGAMQVVISADRKTPHSYVRTAMDFCTASGFKKIKFATLRSNG